MRKTILVLLFLAAAAFLGAGTLEDIDRAVEFLGAFVRRSIPDQEGLAITVFPFLSDSSGRVMLGERLSAELELLLAQSFAKTRIVPQGQGPAGYAVSAELQPYPEKVRILCRIRLPDGSLSGGARFDLPMTAELAALLVPPGFGPSGETSGELFQGQDLPSSLPEGAAGQEQDPFEPDDTPGSEVEVSPSGLISYDRFLTAGDIDRFRFYVPLGAVVTLEAITSLDIQLLLYRNGDRIPFEVRANPSLRSVRLETTLERGYYIVEILAYDFNVQGAYSLTIQPGGSTNDSFEPDNHLEEARPLQPNSRQERILAPGDQDWVEIASGQPGFFALHTTGLQADTVITLYRENQSQMLSDDDSGPQGNAYLGFFLGPGRLLARISGKGALANGPYTLVWERIEPLQIFPGSGVRELQAQAWPLFLQLRILQAGRYLIRKQGTRGPVAAEAYSLPGMKPVAAAASFYSLASGDYLLVMKVAEAQAIRFCVAPEAEAEKCRRSIQE